ncbi:MAG: ribosomal protein S18-alanine N-acetyltransferase [Candidatus Nezhaarchaeota archaeon]|nr:ribosomal protein S18-alanine N-acetyltransferase [Candidatus Nezhaarchaeota archaeon]
MSRLHVRQARLSDLDAISKIEELCFKEPYPKSLLLTLLVLHPDSFFIAEINGEVVGYAVGALMRRVGHIVSIAVHPLHRRKGVGKMLMEALEEALADKRARYFKLEVREDNDEARSFYEKLEYELVGKVRRYYSDGCDALVYCKRVKRRRL